MIKLNHTPTRQCHCLYLNTYQTRYMHRKYDRWTVLSRLLFRLFILLRTKMFTATHDIKSYLTFIIVTTATFNCLIHCLNNPSRWYVLSYQHHSQIIQKISLFEFVSHFLQWMYNCSCSSISPHNWTNLSHSLFTWLPYIFSKTCPRAHHPAS